jgi:hypothetical protein
MYKITLGEMKNLSLDEIIKLYQLGYSIEENTEILNKSYSLVDPIVDPFVNFGKVTVSTGYTSHDTVIVLVTGDGFIIPDPSISGQYNLVWWNSTDYSDPTDDPNKEIIRVISVSGDTITISRPQEGTIASDKNIPGKIYRMINALTAKTIGNLQTYTDSSVENHRLTGVHAVGQIAQIHGNIKHDSTTVDGGAVLGSITQIPAGIPISGQVLTATSSTSANWQTPTGGSPATTVVSGTSFNQTPAVGTSTLYARQDHAHGTPADTALEHIANKNIAGGYAGYDANKFILNGKYGALSIYKDNLGSSAFISNDTLVNTTGTTYVKTATINLVATPDSSLKITFQMKAAGGSHANAYVARNGVQVGTLRSTTSSSYQTYTETISGWNDGDLCQLYANNGDGNYDTATQNFRILGTLGPLITTSNP